MRKIQALKLNFPIIQTHIYTHIYIYIYIYIYTHIYAIHRNWYLFPWSRFHDYFYSISNSFMNQWVTIMLITSMKRHWILLGQENLRSHLQGKLAATMLNNTYRHVYITLFNTSHITTIINSLILAFLSIIFFFL